MRRSISCDRNENAIIMSTKYITIMNYAAANNVDDTTCAETCMCFDEEDDRSSWPLETLIFYCFSASYHLKVRTFKGHL